MAEGNGLLYNNFREQLLDGIFNLASGGHTLKLTLHTGYTPDVDSHATWAHVSATEYSTGDGYTAGGKTISNQVVAQDNDNNRGVLSADNVAWTALGPLSPAAPSHAILWDDSVDGDPLIACWELGETETNGSDYTITWSANGILYV